MGWVSHLPARIKRKAPRTKYQDYKHPDICIHLGFVGFLLEQKGPKSCDFSSCKVTGLSCVRLNLEKTPISNWFSNTYCLEFA